MNEPKPVRCVGGIVYNAAGKLLLVQRGNEPGRGLWSLPGGRVEPGETDAEAVVRELREETGLDVLPAALAGMVLRGPFEIYDYRCTLGGGVLRAGDDAATARWVDAVTLTELDASGVLTEGLTAALRDWDALPR